MNRLALLLIPLGCAVAAWLHVRHHPPVPAERAFGRADVVTFMVAVTLSPALYAFMPTAGTTALVTLLVANGLWQLTAPVAHVWARALPAAVTIGALFVLTFSGERESATAVWYTNGVLAAVVVSIAVGWHQRRVDAGHLAVICAFLTVYDIVCTSVLGWMAPLMHRLSATRPSFLFQLGHGGGSIGVGDVIIAAVIPVTFAGSHGDRWGLAALGTTSVAVAIPLGLHVGHFPLMATLGPLTIALHLVARAARRAPVHRLQLVDAA